LALLLGARACRAGGRAHRQVGGALARRVGGVGVAGPGARGVAALLLPRGRLVVGDELGGAVDLAQA